MTPDPIARTLCARAAARLAALPPQSLDDLVADTVFFERQRLERIEDPAYEALIDAAARTLRHDDRAARQAALLRLVEHYAGEIHNPFSPRTYRFATSVLPGALTRLLSASRGRDLFTRDFDPASRIRLSGPLAELLSLIERGATLILAPTHVSNLDSPLIGYALYAAGLPPFAYGAGLNLFSNPVMAPFMRRLGAYTVDRTKKNRLYKDTLKDYSVTTLRRGGHSLFFPGGTRSRSGRLEQRLKKGLLGTGIIAWQENLRDGVTRSGPLAADIFVVPCTLSIALVLEAETLIADALAEEGKQRYIIMDDAFSDGRQVASFTRRLLQLDAPVHAVFGAPMDLVGNPIDHEGRSLSPQGTPVDRRAYVVGRDGRPVADEQRDQVYTERLSTQLTSAYRRDFVVQSTHLGAWGVWEALRRRHPGRDTWQLVRLPAEDRLLDRSTVEHTIAEALAALAGYPRHLPGGAAAILDEAIERFSHFHKKRAIELVSGGKMQVSPELCLYYRNRLVGHGIGR